MLSPIRRLCGCFLGLVIAATPLVAGEAKESLRQYAASTTTEMSTIAEQLASQMPDSVVILEMGDQVAFSYTGDATPPGLSHFLTSAFADLDPAVLAMGQTVSLTATLAEDDGGTAMGLMLLARFTGSDSPVLDDATVLVDGRGRGGCDGQLILQQPMPQDEAARAYRDLFETRGFAFPDASPQETSFFIGYRQDCELALYLQEQEGESLIVIRYLEN